MYKYIISLAAFLYRVGEGRIGGLKCAKLSSGAK